MKKPNVGLLLLYAGLYEEINPLEKDNYRPYINAVVAQFAQNGIEILQSPICTQENDTGNAVRSFEKHGVCAIVVLFLSYHPSLVSVKALTQTKLPLIILDSTMCYDFGPGIDPVMVSFCHGIHGVQDLCCMLQRYGKSYMIEAGHLEQSGIIRRVCDDIQACHIAYHFTRSRVGIIGRPFEGMGDFSLPFEDIERFTGIRTVSLERERAEALFRSISEKELCARIEKETGMYLPKADFDEKLLILASSGVLAMKEWISQDELDAFTFNFLDFNDDIGFPAIPFVAACQLMAEGIGYAGEGDVLTAALAAALMKVYPDTTFTEMFCPDWKGNMVHLSHMSEANCRILKDLSLVALNLPYTPRLNGGIMPGMAGLYRGGRAVLVNLAPGACDAFRLTLAPCEIVEPAGEDRFRSRIRGWMKTSLSLDTFLKEFSEYGCTHHSCLCYGAELHVLKAFGAAMNWDTHVIGCTMGE